MGQTQKDKYYIFSDLWKLVEYEICVGNVFFST